jgi:hypothetical protein
MMNGNDAAYPSDPDQFSPEFGLTKREEIAARAMQGLLTNAGIVDCYDKIAGLAVNHADALIERLSADPIAEGLNLLPMYSQELDEGLTDA